MAHSKFEKNRRSLKVQIPLLVFPSISILYAACILDRPFMNFFRLLENISKFLLKSLKMNLYQVNDYFSRWNLKNGEKGRVWPLRVPDAMLTGSLYSIHIRTFLHYFTQGISSDKLL